MDATAPYVLLDFRHWQDTWKRVNALLSIVKQLVSIALIIEFSLGVAERILDEPCRFQHSRCDIDLAHLRILHFIYFVKYTQEYVAIGSNAVGYHLGGCALHEAYRALLAQGGLTVYGCDAALRSLGLPPPARWAEEP